MMKKSKIMHNNSYEFSAFVTKFVLVLGVVIFVGSCVNYQGYKYIRSTGTECQNSLLVLSISDSHLCCDDVLHSGDLVCAGAFDKIEHLLKSDWALILPLVPVMLTLVTERFLLKKPIHISSIPALKRMLFYFCISIYRLVRNDKQYLSSHIFHRICRWYYTGSL